MKTERTKRGTRESGPDRQKSAVKQLPSKIKKDVSSLLDTAYLNEYSVIESNYKLGLTVAKSLNVKVMATDARIKEISIALNKKVQTLYQAYAVTELYTLERIQELFEKAKENGVLFEWKFFVYLTKLHTSNDTTLREHFENDLVSGTIRGATLNNKIKAIFNARDKASRIDSEVDSSELFARDNDAATSYLKDCLESFKRRVCTGKVEAVIRNTVNDMTQGVYTQNNKKNIKQIRNLLKGILDKLEYFYKLIPDDEWTPDKLSTSESLDAYSTKLKNILLHNNLIGQETRNEQ